jgi:membrane protein implicated in regulation of membrane protease activity
MFLIVALVVLLFAPDPWNLVGFLIALGLFFGEVAYWTRVMRRRRVQTGAQTLLGRRGRVVKPFDRTGQVRLDGESEIWSARTLEGAPVGGAVTVVGVDGISLVVEPAREQ